MSSVSQRVECYAAALFELAKAADALERIESDLHALLDLFDSQPSIRSFLDAPGVRVEGCRQALRELLSDRIHAMLLDFLLILVGRGDVGLLPQIPAAFVKRVAGSPETLFGELVAARELDRPRVRAVEQALSRRLSRPVRLRVKIRPEVLGGIAVRVGHLMLDGTVQTRLASARTALCL